MANLHALQDMMMRAGANLQDAIEKKDLGRADRNRKMVIRLNAVAQQEVDKANAGVPMPGAKVQGPQKVGEAPLPALNKAAYPQPPAQQDLPLDSEGNPMELTKNENGIVVPKSKKQYIGGVRGTPMEKELPQSHFNQVPDYSLGDVTKGVGQAVQDGGLDKMSLWELADGWSKGIPGLRGVTKLKESLLGGEPQKYLTGEKKPLEEVGKLFKSDADLEKKIGSPAALPTPPPKKVETPGGASAQDFDINSLWAKDTEGKVPFQGILKDAKMPDSGGPRMQSADPGGMKNLIGLAKQSDSPEDFAARVKAEAPSLFTPERLLTLLFFGTRGMFHTYDQDQENYRQKQAHANQFKLASSKKEVMNPIELAKLGLEERKIGLDEHKLVQDQKNWDKEFAAKGIHREMEGVERERHDYSMSPAVLPRMDQYEADQKVSRDQMKALMEQLRQLRMQAQSGMSKKK